MTRTLCLRTVRPARKADIVVASQHLVVAKNRRDRRKSAHSVSLNVNAMKIRCFLCARDLGPDIHRCSNMIDHISVQRMLEAYAEAPIFAPHDGRTDRADRSDADRHPIPL